jgi:hypothetical protein
MTSDAGAVRDAMVMARTATLEMVQVLIDVARDKRKPAAARVKAAETLLNRALGMPVQSIDVLQIRNDLRKNLADLPLGKLREFKRRLEDLEALDGRRVTIEAIASPPEDGNDLRVD